MFRIALLAVSLALLAPQVAFAQTPDGEVYAIARYNAHTGQEAEYSQGYRDWLRPVFDDLVQQGAINGYRDLAKNTGTDDSTHLVIIVYPNWAALDSFGPKLDEASRRVLGRPWSEVVDDFNQMRDPAGSEIYTAPPGN